MSERKNKLRVKRAVRVIKAYDGSPNDLLEVKIVDCIADLLHLAQLYVDGGAERMLRIAKNHFDEEAAGND